MAASYQYGYRIALFCSGALALYLGGAYGWPLAYAAMAFLTLVGMVTVFVIREPSVTRDNAAQLQEQRVTDFLARSAHMNRQLRNFIAWFTGAVICPFVDFVRRKGSLAAIILLFVAVFRISDVMMGSLASKVYVDLGFTENEVAVVVKSFGLAMTFIGAFLGGLFVVRYGIMGPLVLAAAMIAGTNLSFAWLALEGHSITALAITISADNITGGLAGSVFIAYLSSLTSSNYTATQYALFSSLMTLPGKLFGSQSGNLAIWLGLNVEAGTNRTLNPEAYSNFFVFVAAIGIPSILLAIYLYRQAAAERRAGTAGSPAG
jgi:PAT family beta-lactamase induction signal transducer AmpG